MQGPTGTVRITSKYKIYHDGDVATFPLDHARRIVEGQRGIWWDHENDVPGHDPDMVLEAKEETEPEPKTPKSSRRKKERNKLGDDRDLNAKEGNYETR